MFLAMLNLTMTDFFIFVCFIFIILSIMFAAGE